MQSTDQPLGETTSPVLRNGACGSGTVERLDAREFRRRCWHVLPGFLPFLLWPIPHRDPISPRLLIIILAITAVIAGSLVRRYHEIARSGETDGVVSVAGYALSFLLTLLILPAHAEIGMAVLALLAFGDGCATLGGLVLRGPALPWNAGKRWTGTAAFVVVGGAMASVVYWGEAQPGVPFSTALAVVLPAALVSGLCESLPLRSNDNLRVGVSAAFGLALAHAVVVGL